MPKRRDKPVENPLKMDLIRNTSQATIAAPEPKPEKPKPAAQAPPQLKPKLRTETAQERIQQPARNYETKNHSMRTRFDPGEHEANVQLVEAMQRLMGGSKVTESHITRALWSLARRAEDVMQENAKKAPQLPRPPHGNRLAQAEYEDAIADFLLFAFRRTDR